MKRDKIIRILELIENPALEKNPNAAHFAFAEYLQNTNGGKVSTNRIFQVPDFQNHIEDHLYFGKLLTAQLELNIPTESDIYQFYFKEDSNLEPTNISNVKTSQLALVIPGELKQKYANDEQLQQLNEYLAGETLLVNEINERRNRHERYAIQKKNRFKTVVALGALTAVLLSGAVYPYIQNKQAQMRQKEIQNKKQYEEPTRQELQEQYHNELYDTEFNQYLQNIRTEHEEQKKLP